MQLQAKAKPAAKKQKTEAEEWLFGDEVPSSNEEDSNEEDNDEEEDNDKNDKFAGMGSFFDEDDGIFG